MASQKNRKTTSYFGLCTTYHDPALAVVDERGSVLFAEASERYLQYKRGLNCTPDSLARVSELIEDYCPDSSKFVIARNWSKRRPWYEMMWWLCGYYYPSGLSSKRHLKLSTFLPKYQLLHMMASQKHSMAAGGLNLVRMIRESRPDAEIEVVDFNHHLCHAAMACYSSQFDSAGCVIIDSFGDRGSSAFYNYRRGRIERISEISGIESLGFYYMRLTELCGFSWLKGEEWKVMGLAAYGQREEQIVDVLQQMLVVNGLAFQQSKTAIVQGFEHLQQLLGNKQVNKADMAHSGQYFFETVMLQLLRNFSEQIDSRNLVLGGGCLLNSSLNGKIIDNTPFNQIHIPSAPGDDGTALGAAWLAYRNDHDSQVNQRNTLSPYLGSRIKPKTLDNLLQFGDQSIIHHYPDSIAGQTATLLAKGALVGWMQNRAEFGPRALGNRSILADPRDPGMRDKINCRVKFREEFRPFAPSILHDYGPVFFENYQESPYMERTLRFKQDVQDKVPAVVHVDGTGRLQTVKQEWNPQFYALIEAFRQITGIPMILNTSFNVMSKPIVHSVEDAVSVFYTSGLDVLVIGDYLLVKPELDNE